MERMQHFPVNWVDGMKISKQQFLELENNLFDQIRDANALGLTDYNFGILPAPESGRDSLMIDVSSDHVDLKSCRAITRAGARIEIMDLDYSALRQPLQHLMGSFDFRQSPFWYVVVGVNPFERVPYGNPAPDTVPVRQLYATPKYELSIIPSEQTLSPKIAAYAIPVAKIRGGTGGTELDRTYIPPCARLNSSMELLHVHHQLDQELGFLLDKAVLIIQKITFRRKRESLNPLANDIYLMASRTMEFITNTLDAYRMLLPHQPPIMFIEYFMRFARTQHTALMLIQYKDLTMDYFDQKIREFQINVFNSAIQNLINLTYNHFEVRQALDKVENLMEQLKVLFGSLSTMDYENLPVFDPVTQTTTYGRGATQRSSQPQYMPPQQTNIPTSGQRGDVRIKRKGDQTDTGGDRTLGDDLID